MPLTDTGRVVISEKVSESGKFIFASDISEQGLPFLSGGSTEDPNAINVRIDVVRSPGDSYPKRIQVR